MKNSIKCMFGLHVYEIHSKDPLVDFRGNIIGRVIISKCAHCGKIKTNKVYLVEHY